MTFMVAPSQAFVPVSEKSRNSETIICRQMFVRAVLLAAGKECGTRIVGSPSRSANASFGTVPPMLGLIATGFSKTSATDGLSRDFLDICRRAVKCQPAAESARYSATGASPKWSRRVCPVYSVRNRPRFCRIGTTSAVNSSSCS